jgi:hypothetical protein
MQAENNTKGSAALGMCGMHCYVEMPVLLIELLVIFSFGE